ncbi:MAG TPA: phosphotransferase [Vicinamibacterales bacterium]
MAADEDLVRTIGLALARRAMYAGIVEIVRRPSPYASTACLEDVDVRLTDGTVLHLVHKDLRPDALADGDRAVRPAGLADPAREPLVYRELLEPAGIGTPRCLCAEADPTAGRHFVVVDRIDGLQLCDVGDPAVWDAAARWLARLHVRLQSSACRAARRGDVPLLVYDTAFHRRWLAEALANVRVSERDVVRRRAFEALAPAYGAIVSDLATRPPTFLHGECYPSNVLVEDDGTIRPVDWEMAALGPGAFDLATLTSGDWPAADRVRMIAAYRDELRAEGVHAPALEALVADVERCRLLLAVRLLAWHPAWTPPRAHARDWLGEAIRIADRL